MLLRIAICLCLISQWHFSHRRRPNQGLPSNPFPSVFVESNENMRRIKSSKEMSNLSLQIEKYPRDLLQRFISSDSKASIRSEEEEEVELNLGLSLGGRFGVDKNAKKLTRASSIAGSMPTLRQDRDSPINIPPTVPYPILKRTSSLPAETEEEWRKRKESQSLRRMEAKRRRIEKQRSSRVKMEAKFLEEEKRWAPPCYQGSIEMEKKALQGANSFGEAGSSGSTQSLQDQGNQEATYSSRSKISETMEDMPCVFTKGDGLNGKRVDGILYKYGKGEEVRIMCICHGNFLSAAEFVKHAGGNDVDHPLRHIVVNPSSASFY